VLGESEKKTVALLDAAVGSVLVIDEAYGLYSANGRDPYKVWGWRRNLPFAHITYLPLTPIVMLQNRRG
jgi:hypothetical protein